MISEEDLVDQFTLVTGVFVDLSYELETLGKMLLRLLNDDNR